MAIYVVWVEDVHHNANNLIVRCCFLLGLLSSEICLTCELSETTKDFNQEEREGYLVRRA